MLVDVHDAPMPGANLIYIYDVTSTNEAEPPVSAMTATRLLTAPIWTDSQGWFRGYFVTVAHMDVTEQDQLDRYCFADNFMNRHRYVDEHGRVIPERLEPCGEWSLSSHLGVDETVSAALGLPLASD